MMAIDISRFMPRDRFETLAMEYAQKICNSKKAENVHRIFLPGEIEAANVDQVRANRWWAILFIELCEFVFDPGTI